MVNNKSPCICSSIFWIVSLLLFIQSDTFLTTHQNAAQRVLDGMNFVIQSVSEYSTGPTKAVTAWLTDQVAPPYWRPNTEIIVSRTENWSWDTQLKQHRKLTCVLLMFYFSIKTLQLLYFNVCPEIIPPLLLLFSLMLFRPVMGVRRCLKRQRGSITVDLVVRVSVIPAPAIGCQYQREAGAVVLLGCVRPVTAREGRPTPTARVSNVHTVSRLHLW